MTKKVTTLAASTLMITRGLNSMDEETRRTAELHYIQVELNFWMKYQDEHTLMLNALKEIAELGCENRTGVAKAALAKVNITQRST